MSLTAPKNTLAYQRKGRPLALHRSLANLPVTGSILPMKQFASTYGTSAKPEVEALWFYMANHAVKEVEFRFDPDEPLPDPVLKLLELYNAKCSVIAARAFYYLLLITCRESRHCKSKSDYQPHMQASWGAAATNAFIHGYPDQNSISAVTNVFDTHASAATLAQVTEVVRYSFYQPGAYNGGYGGKAWGKVSDCLCAYVTGEYSAEMMLDTVWTLCHNNGPIFNKGMLYDMYSGALVEILDVQRSGQIPQIVISKQSGTKTADYVKTDMREFCKQVHELFPDAEAFHPDAKVDWHAVEALGSNHKYSQYKGGGAAAGTIKVDGTVKSPSHKPKMGGGYPSPGHIPSGSLTADASISSSKGGSTNEIYALAKHAGMTFKKKSVRPAKKEPA